MKTLLAIARMCILSGVIALCGTAGAGQGQILGLPVGHPQVDTNAVGGTCSYNASNGTLTLTAAATIVVFDSASTNVGFVDFGVMTLSANIGAGGALTGGSFTLTGEVTDFNTFDFFGSPLLTGTLTDYGIDLPGTTDQADFRVSPTGGSLLARYPAGDDIAVRVTLEGSTYNGSFANNWGCTRPKSVIGPTPPAVQETCALALTKTANPTTIGPIVVPPGNDKPDDSDVDSGNDTDNDGDSDSEDSGSGVPVDCGCKGKVSELTLKYNGTQAADVIVTRKAPFSVVLYQGTVQPGAQFTVLGSNFGPNGFKGTLGTAIEIAINGGDTVELHTSCSQPIGPGLVVGNFEVVSGKSRKLSVPLCPIVPDACPANQQVTYTYTLTNNGSPLTNVTLDDDKLGNIDVIALLNSGQTVTRTKQACLFQTTTNTATALGMLPSGSHCAADPAMATVQLIIPPPPPPPGCTSSDSDSDSGLDGNHNGDSDDSDADSGPLDCDSDGDAPPPPPVSSYDGCSHGYWKSEKHKSQWTNFKRGDKFSAVFQVDSGGNRSLIDTLEMGGGGAKALGREAVAAMLNATNPNVHYFYTGGEVKAIVQNAYTTKDFETAKNLLEQYNNAGCPLN